MASGTKRAWKLQEFIAHGANVNCLALGNKSGRVLATGGDDKKVNLWAVGKPNCIMSLSGHTTPVERVRFGNSEELVCAGSMSGALKIWDLEAAKIVRTLTGHKANIRSIDFHPYGEFLSSGSVDTNIKLWDIRRKGCIFTYKGHRHTVNSLKFSPDGRWIASAGEDGVVKLWDLPAGKMLAEFIGHGAPVNDVQFHPNEFLLASGSSDKAVKFWDLESFQLVSTTDGDSSAIRCIYFNPDGECLYSGSQDYLRIYGWEPARVHDSVEVKWGKVADISTTQTQLIGASYHLMQVSLFIIDLKKVQPFASVTSQQGSVCTNSTALQPGTPMRRSFIRRPPPTNTKNSQDIPVTEELDVSTPELDSGSDTLSVIDIKDPDDYKEIFQPRNRELGLVEQVKPDLKKSEVVKPEPRRPEPVKPEPKRTEVLRLERKISPVRTELVRPEIIQREPIKQTSIRVESKSETYTVEQFRSERVTNEKVLHSPIEPQLPTLLRLEPTIEVITPHPLSVVHTTTRKLEQPSEIITMQPKGILDMKMEEYVSDKLDKGERVDFVPAQLDHSVGLNVEEFLPIGGRRYHDTLQFGGQQHPEMSEAEAISSIIKQHESMIHVLTSRHRNVQIIHTLWANKDLKTAMESAVHMNDLSVIVDVLSNISLKPSIWSLDLCVTLLPSIYELLQSKYETYMTAGCCALRIVLKNFASVIRTNISAPPTSIGIDLSREERYNKCMSCYNQLMSIRAFILKRQTLQGKLGQSFRDLHVLMQALD